MKVEEEKKEPEIVLGKRKGSDQNSAEGDQKPANIHQKKRLQKADQKEKKAVKSESTIEAEGVRKSARNVGKTAIYDIDKYLDQFDKSETGTVGGGGINVMLAQNYDPEQNDPAGWYMSEKLDGVRCYWDGKAMYTRNGHLFYPPDEWKEKLPKMALDGELWSGRDDFQKIVSIVRRQDKNDEWKNIKYMIFDAPKIKAPFKKRLATLEKELKKCDSNVVVLHKHEICKSREHMLEELEKVCAKKGEGLMIRDPDALYENRRSNTLLKVKKFDDGEAVVLGHKPGTGRCSAMMGAIFVRNDNGIEFKIGSGFNDKQRRKPPKIGTRITYKHMGVSKAGKPRFPIFMREHPGM